MTQLTIGELAKEAGVSRSMLRYYEEQGLLRPVARTAAGYRLYAPAAAQTLLFIQRAQRLGFSLGDIQVLLDRLDRDALFDETVVALAEERYLHIERQLTELLVLRHEMGAFLSDLDARVKTGEGDSHNLYHRLIRRVCGPEPGESQAREALTWLLDRTGCALASIEREELLTALEGRHIHVWRDDDSYKVLIPGHEPELEAALSAIAGVEADCHAHATPRLERTDEGFMFSAEGDKAFLFAQFFLDLEAGSGHLESGRDCASS
jgi:DNA-binding transcriptional MerR regulator